jgi:hypothetical protein
MNPQFLAMLPPELRATVREVERLAECEIAVIPDASANDFDSLKFGVDNGVCIAEIAYRGGSIAPCALLHEVLHVKRYCLDSVPVLRPASRWSSAPSNDAPMLDELIEHLIIIPEERRFREAESSVHWSEVMGSKLAEVPRLDSPSSLQRSLMLQHAMMDIALPELDHTRLYARLRDERLFERSTAFVENLRTVLNDKLRALKVVCQAFRYDLTAFRVGRYDLQTNPKQFVPIPWDVNP